jgi:hypothetical protein
MVAGCVSALASTPGAGVGSIARNAGVTLQVYSSGATKLIGLVGGPSARQVESDSEELSSKDGR